MPVIHHIPTSRYSLPPTSAVPCAPRQADADRPPSYAALFATPRPRSVSNVPATAAACPVFEPRPTRSYPGHLSTPELKALQKAETKVLRRAETAVRKAGEKLSRSESKVKAALKTRQEWEDQVAIDALGPRQWRDLGAGLFDQDPVTVNEQYLDDARAKVGYYQQQRAERQATLETCQATLDALRADLVLGREPR